MQTSVLCGICELHLRVAYLLIHVSSQRGNVISVRGGGEKISVEINVPLGISVSSVHKQ